MQSCNIQNLLLHSGKRSYAKIDIMLFAA